jgi:hypothetical protein
LDIVAVALACSVPPPNNMSLAIVMETDDTVGAAGVGLVGESLLHPAKPIRAKIRKTRATIRTDLLTEVSIEGVYDRRGRSSYFSCSVNSSTVSIQAASSEDVGGSSYA